jgi:hypothetical protein
MKLKSFVSLGEFSIGKKVLVNVAEVSQLKINVFKFKHDPKELKGMGLKVKAGRGLCSR